MDAVLRRMLNLLLPAELASLSSGISQQTRRELEQIWCAIHRIDQFIPYPI